MLTYRVDQVTDEEATADPFGGHGELLPLDAGAAEILDALERAAGAVLPAVAFDRVGAWLDRRVTGDSQMASIRAGWGDGG